ncbi:hypothetical protein BBD46_17215 [Natrialba sp. SSL1]|nr:hypothetical protein BBD46_17215 [Natrialba sp. SSL1]
MGEWVHPFYSRLIIATDFVLFLGLFVCWDVDISSDECATIEVLAEVRTEVSKGLFHVALAVVGDVLVWIEEWIVLKRSSECVGIIIGNFGIECGVWAHDVDGEVVVGAEFWRCRGLFCKNIRDGAFVVLEIRFAVKHTFCTVWDIKEVSIDCEKDTQK